MNIRTSLILLVVVAIWGLNVVTIRAGAVEMAPVTFLTLRFSLTSLLFLPFIRWPGRRNFRVLFEVGFWMCVVHQGLMYIAMPMIHAGTMSILLQMQVIFATLIGVFFLKETIGWRSWAGIIMGFIGVAILMGGPSTEGRLLGFAIGIISAFFVALSYVRMKALEDIHPPTFIGLINLLSVPFVFVLSLFMDADSWNHLDTVDWELIAPILLFQSTVISTTHIIWQKLLTQNPVSQVVPWVLLMPVFAVLFAALWLGDPITLPVVAGGTLTIAGVGIVTLRRIQKGKQAPVDVID